MKNFLVPLLFLWVGVWHSQTFQIEYTLTTEYEDTDSQMRQDLGEEEYEKMMSFMNQSKTYTLTYCNGYSLFAQDEIPVEEQSRSYSTTLGNYTYIYKFVREKSNKQWYKDFGKQQITRVESILNRDFLIEEPLNTNKWKLLNEEKIIGDFKCKKATLQEDDKEIVAYYTEEIPIQDGPGKYYGLPGLIIELKKGKNTYYVTKLTLIDKNTPLTKPEKGKPISREDFEKLKQKKAKN